MLLKIQNVGKKQKTKKKRKPCALPALRPFPDHLASAPLVWTSLSSAQGGGAAGVGAGAALGPAPGAGLGGASGLFMYLLHTHQPMQVPRPSPHVSVPLLIPHSPPGLLSPPPTSPRKWDGQGPPPLESAGCPVPSPLLLPASPIFTPHQRELAMTWHWEVVRGAATQREARATPTP